MDRGSVKKMVHYRYALVGYVLSCLGRIILCGYGVLEDCFYVDEIGSIKNIFIGSSVAALMCVFWV